MRVVLWSQHLLGSGHLQRASRIAEALAAAGAAVVLVNGGRAPAASGLGYRRLDLPVLAARSAAFDGLIDAHGDAPTEALWEARSRALKTVLKGPVDAFVVEHFPFGRRAFARELMPLLERLHGRTPRPVCLVSVRDVLVEHAKPGRAEATVALIHRWFDRVLVHGDRRLVPFERTFARAADLADRLTYTGYVLPPLPRPRDPGEGVLVSAGGGAVGRHLVAAALDAATRVAGPWTVVAGRELDEAAFRDFVERCPRGVELLRHVDDLPERLAAAAVSVSQAGYNTVLETLALQRPMVLVPFAAGAETEQTTRAAAVAALGAARVLDETAIDGPTLAAAVTAARATPVPMLDLQLDGAATAARLILDLAGRRR